MDEKFEVSVVIPTYNRCALLQHTLNSMLEQTFDKNDFEVIVSDDGSSDGTAAVVATYQDRLNISYLYQPDNGYCVSSARNAGIRHSSGKICLLIDAGVILDKECINEHAAFYWRRGSAATAIGYVYGFELNDDPAYNKQLMTAMDVTDASRSISRMAADSRYFDVREIHYQEYEDDLSRISNPWVFYWTCHVSLPTATLREVGMFDEKYDGNWGIEDNDLGYRLKQAGVEFHLLRTAMSAHYPHQKSDDRYQQGLVNCRYFDKKFSTVDTKIFLRNYIHNGR